MKVCLGCGQNLTLDQFHKKRNSVAARCKDCVRVSRAAKYKTRTQQQKDQALVRKQRANDKLNTVIRELKRNPCVDCGKTYHFAAMDFDHIGTNKIANVSRFVALGNKQALLDEVVKCELVCANCHRIRTYIRRSA